MNRVSQNQIRVRELVAAERGLSDIDARATLRRQFIGSVVVALAVMVAAGLSAVRPSHNVADYTSHRVSTVQQPTFVDPADRVIALRQH